jgi:hypothetical protein
MLPACSVTLAASERSAAKLLIDQHGADAGLRAAGGECQLTVICQDAVLLSEVERRCPH